MNNLRQLWQWFLSLEARDRRVLGAGVIVLVLFILYAAILSPYVHHRQALWSELQSQQTLLAWMRPAALRLESLPTSPRSALPGGSLLGAVNNNVASAGLGSALQQAQTINSGAVRVQFSGANFDRLTRWLTSLQQVYGIAVSDATVTRAAGPGLVDASLVLQAPGS
ncbi:MAG: type II secretion system protein GspM [Gammaproteobacteria bacterium]